MLLSTFSQSTSMNKIKSATFKTLSKCINDTLSIFKDTIEEYYAIETELDNYKLQLEESKSKPCQSCKDLQKVIASKECLIQSIVSMLKKLNCMKDLNLINDIFMLVNDDPQILTPLETNSDASSSIRTEKSNENIDDDSSSEIEGTPLGRVSPILSIANKRKEKRKKKSSCQWPTPESKTLKLTHTTPIRTPKMKQLRLKFPKTNESNVVDLTTLPGARQKSEKNAFQLKELMENEDTILPSPTSVSKQEFSHIYKSFEEVISSGTFKKSKSKLSQKKDRENITPIQLEQGEDRGNETVDLLQPTSSRVKAGPLKTVRDADETFCDSFDAGRSVTMKKPMSCSPSKSPLIENINAGNLSQDYSESMLLLPQNGVVNGKNNPSNVIKQEKYEPIYKEATIRKKSEKLALPGWSCDKCKNFYDILYKDNPAMLQKLMTECSRHRGRNNPARPATPPGYWNPRWDVAVDTEIFNRENNAN